MDEIEPEKIKKPTATAMHRKSIVTPIAPAMSSDAWVKGIYSQNIGQRLATIHRSTPKAVRYACFAESLRNAAAVSRESVLAAGIA